MKSAILFLLCATAACADDGMWLFNQFPTDAVEAKYELRQSPRRSSTICGSATVQAARRIGCIRLP